MRLIASYVARSVVCLYVNVQSINQSVNQSVLELGLLLTWIMMDVPCKNGWTVELIEMLFEELTRVDPRNHNIISDQTGLRSPSPSPREGTMLRMVGVTVTYSHYIVPRKNSPPCEWGFSLKFFDLLFFVTIHQGQAYSHIAKLRLSLRRISPITLEIGIVIGLPRSDPVQAETASSTVDERSALLNWKRSNRLVFTVAVAYNKNSSGDEIANVNFLTTISHTRRPTSKYRKKDKPTSFNKLDDR